MLTPLFALIFGLSFALPPSGGNTPTPPPPAGLPAVPPNPLLVVGKSKQTILNILNDEKPYTNFQDFFHRYAPVFEGVKYGAGGKGLKIGQTLINVEEMDCVTFVENMLALALTQKSIQQKNYPPDNTIRFNHYVEQLNFVRYYQGVNCDETDRMHYFTAAFEELEKGGLWFNVGRASGLPFTKKINFISQNPKKFGFTNTKRIVNQENALSAAKRYFYPLNELYRYEAVAQPGDVIGLATDVAGLDVSHVGFIDVENDELYFTHSTLVSKQVNIKELFCFYLSRRTTITGIFVYRPTF